MVNIVTDVTCITLVHGNGFQILTSFKHARIMHHTTISKTIGERVGNPGRF